MLGIALAGSVAGTQPASAGYACGPWNGWCSYFRYPGWGWGWYGYKAAITQHWNKSYSHKNWDNDWNKGNGKYKGQRLQE